METEIILTGGNLRAVVSSHGAALRRFYRVEVDGRDSEIVWGYSGGQKKIGGQGDVLIPFPSRIKDARYAFEGREYRMPVNDKQGPNAIHGFLREESWTVAASASATARFEYAIRPERFAPLGYPFSLDVAIEYRIDGAGLECEFVLRNAGEGRAPAGVGYHPYFTAGTETVDSAEAVIPANAALDFEPTLVPTGKLLPVEGSPLDFRRPRRIGGTVLDHCFTGLIRDPDGRARASLRDPRTGRGVTVWMDEAFDYLVLFTGDTLPAGAARRALAIEPMTCATDAFNRPEWGLRVLEPGETFRGRFGIEGAA